MDWAKTLQDETRNIQVLVFGAAFIIYLTVSYLHNTVMHRKLSGHGLSGNLVFQKNNRTVNNGRMVALIPLSPRLTRVSFNAPPVRITEWELISTFPIGLNIAASKRTTSLTMNNQVLFIRHHLQRSYLNLVGWNSFKNKANAFRMVPKVTVLLVWRTRMGIPVFL